MTEKQMKIEAIKGVLYIYVSITIILSVLCSIGLFINYMAKTGHENISCGLVIGSIFSIISYYAYNDMLQEIKRDNK
jgi:hypothetical protein